MSKPKPRIIDLEFSGEDSLWREEASAQRRVFLMPVLIPSKFVAFGVIGSEEMPHFVAWGLVHEHLEVFIARMVRDDATVELYVRAPLPEEILKEYASDPPIEGHEYEEPPPPPVNGLVPGRTVAYRSLRTTPVWPEGAHATRRVFLLPVLDPSEFLALGTSGDPSHVLFAIHGKVRDELGAFISQMVEEEAQVELYAQPPLPEALLRQYLAASPGEHPER